MSRARVADRDVLDRILADAALAPVAGAESLFGDGLRVLVGALRTEAALTPAGTAEAEGALRKALAVRAQAAAWSARRPAAATAIDRPIVVTGMHRTGTTYLQRLLAAHPDVRAPALWELMHPVPAGAEEDVTPLVDQTRAYVAAYNRAAPAFRAIHALDASRPEECHRLLGTTFCSAIYELRYRVPGYAAWLETVDMRIPYRTHRTLLRALLSRAPAGRVLLKCPLHVRHLDALFASYPDAVVVQLHRAPHETIASAANLVATIRGSRSDRIDRAEIGAYWLRRMELLAAHALAGGEPGSTVLHVRYEDLVERPAAVLDEICDRAGLAAPRQPVGPARTGARSAAAAPTLADFGLNRREVDRRFAAYREHFRV